MADAITLFRFIYTSFINWIFGIEMVSGVSFGWFLCVVFILWFIIRRFVFISVYRGDSSDE